MTGIDRRICCLLLLATSAVYCCTAHAAEAQGQVGSETRHDVADLRRDADDIEKRISSSGLLYGRAELDAYVQGVADGLRRPDEPQSIRLQVLKSPWPNAFVLPNGAAYVTTAMLDMLDNEAQLACVVGHEMTHFVEQHALQEMRAQKTRQGWSTAFAVLLGAIGAYYGGSQAGSLLADLTASAGQLWTLSAVSGYSRDHEREADRQGFQRLTAAGYDASQASLVFEQLLARTPAQAAGERPYFATHPRLEERIVSFRELAGTQTAPATGRVETERFVTAVGDLPLDQAAILIEANEPALAQLSLDRYLSRRPDSARAYFLAGLAWQARTGEPGWADQALAAYGRAASLPDAPPAALRNKGLLHRERGELALAREAFERYLALDPQAVDAGIVRLYLQELAASPP